MLRRLLPRVVHSRFGSVQLGQQANTACHEARLDMKSQSLEMSGAFSLGDGRPEDRRLRMLEP